MNPTGETLGYLIFMVVVSAAVGLFLRSVYRRFRLVMLGRPEARFDHLWERIKSVLIYGIAQKRMVRERYAGVMHVLIFWGFLALFIRTFSTVAEGFYHGFNFPFMRGSAGLAYASLLDLFEGLVLVGVFLAAYRRLVSKPRRLTLNWDGLLALVFITGLMVTDITLRGLSITTGGGTSGWTPVASSAASLLERFSGDFQAHLFYAAWWAHVTILMSFLVYLPHSKHFHILIAIPNIFMRSLRPYGELPVTDFENEESFGAGRAEDFTRKQLFDLLVCTECGRCQDACPAFASEKPLSPKELNVDMREHLYQLDPSALKAETDEGDTLKLIGDSVQEDTIWACTTCRACEESCPVFIEFVDRFVEMRRHLVMEEGKVPPDLALAFKNIEVNGNPWGLASTTRGDWADGLEVKRLSEGDKAEYLYWVGCAGSYDERNRKVSRALVRVLKEAGVDFGILGHEEFCTGDPVRRAGNEYLFQTLARRNLETLKKRGVDKIITACPHCFNTLKNEYAQLGGELEVVHHTQLLDRLLREGRLRLTKPVNEKVTFHDACYMGRYNNVYDEPRRVLEAIPGLESVEMERCREKSFCCGAGGGHMWFEMNVGKKTNAIRAEHILEVNPSLASTSCPFCLIMIDDGIRYKDAESRVRVEDIVELIEKAL